MRRSQGPQARPALEGQTKKKRVHAEGVEANAEGAEETLIDVLSPKLPISLSPDFKSYEGASIKPPKSQPSSRRHHRLGGGFLPRANQGPVTRGPFRIHAFVLEL